MKQKKVNKFLLKEIIKFKITYFKKNVLKKCVVVIKCCFIYSKNEIINKCHSYKKQINLNNLI